VIPCALIIRFVEWPKGRGGRPTHHVFEPREAEWIVNDEGRKSCVMPDGARIEKTAFLHCLFEGRPVTFAFKSTAIKPVIEAVKAMEKVCVAVDGAEMLLIGGLWRIATAMQENSYGRWFLPALELVGKLGEEGGGGPSLEDCRAAKAARIDLK